MDTCLLPSSPLDMLIQDKEWHEWQPKRGFCQHLAGTLVHAGRQPELTRPFKAPSLRPAPALSTMGPSAQCWLSQGTTPAPAPWLPEWHAQATCKGAYSLVRKERSLQNRMCRHAGEEKRGQAGHHGQAIVMPTMSLGRASRTQTLRELLGFGGQRGLLSNPSGTPGSRCPDPHSAAGGTGLGGYLPRSALPQTAEYTTKEVTVQGRESEVDSLPLPWKVPGLPWATSLTGTLRLILS